MKKLTIQLSILLFPLLLLIFAPVAHAQSKSWAGTNCVGPSDLNLGSNQAAGAKTTVDASQVPTIQGFQCLIGNVLSVALSGIGLIGFVMFIVGAFYYMLSGGNAKGTETARNTITYAVIGLVVALSAFIILNLIYYFTGVKSILSFQIPGSSNGL